MKRTFLLVALIGLTASAAASAGTRVSSDSDCPSSDAVSARLLGLVATGGPESVSVRVHDDGQSLRIELSTPGEPTQERTLPLGGDCEERAEMAALVIASWLDAMPAGKIKAPGIPPRERREDRGGRSAQLDPDDPNWEPPIRISGRSLVGAGILGMADSQGASGGLALGASLPELIEDFGLSAEASLAWYREMQVGQGTTRYWRPTFALRATAEMNSRRWVARVFLGPALGVLSVKGSGYDNDLSATTVMWGVDFGLGLVWPRGRHEAWLSMGCIAWPQGRRILTRSSLPYSDAALPEWEGRMVLGYSWGVFELWK